MLEIMPACRAVLQQVWPDWHAMPDQSAPLQFTCASQEQTLLAQARIVQMLPMDPWA